eukprot:19262-Heterococcus_DN1.PRE.1
MCLLLTSLRGSTPAQGVRMPYSAAAAASAAAGTVKVVLADVGLFRVCLFRGAALCPAPTYCVTAEAATGRPDTWPTYVEEKNYCYVYPSAVFDKLGKPARTPVLCSRDSVNLLAVSATGGSQAHQWGSVTLDVPASGLLSGLYGLDNIYVYSAVTHFNVCGVALQQQFPTAGGTVLQTQEGFVLEATAESSGSCPPPLGGAGYPLNVATLTEVVPYFGGSVMRCIGGAAQYQY